MTGPTEEVPRRRAGDDTAKGRLVAWWRRWGQLITGVWLMLVSTILTVLALGFYQQKSDTANAARISCQRSKALGPKLADYYARDPAFPQDVLKLYRRTIPHVCPTK